MLYVFKKRITAPIEIDTLRVRVSRRALSKSIALAIKLREFPPSNDKNNPNYKFGIGDSDVRNRPIDIVVRDNNEIVKFNNCMLNSYHETDLTQYWTFICAMITFPKVSLNKGDLYVCLKNTTEFEALIYNALHI